jgi:predicted RNase H-like HicB family nuclease
MEGRFVLTDYVDRALALAVYDKLDDGTFAGRIPACKGVHARGTALRECQDQLRSTLEGWILASLKLGHPLPVLGGIDLNQVPPRDYRDAIVAVPADRLAPLVGMVSLGGDAVEDAAKYDQ